MYPTVAVVHQKLTDDARKKIRIRVSSLNSGKTRTRSKATTLCASYIRNGSIRRWTIRNSIRVLSMTKEKFRGLKVEDPIDDRIVRKVKKEGTF